MSKFVVVLSAIWFASSAEALRGRVFDGVGTPLSGVAVGLVQDGASVLTEVDGSFSLQPNAPLDARRADRSSVRVRLQGNSLLLTGSMADVVSLRTVDLAGKEVSSSSGLPGEGGAFRYDVFGSRSAAPGIYLVEYRFGTASGAIRVAATPGRLASGPLVGPGLPSVARSAAAGPLDSLGFSKSGFVTRRLPVTDEAQDLGAVVLDREGVSYDGDYGISWNSTVGYGRLVDERDGQAYRTVQIGGQRWMAENLNHRRAGADSGWWLGNSPDSGAKYGRFYSWAAVMNLPDSCNRSSCANQVQATHRGLCPTGWHVPNDSEWTTLLSAIGGVSTGGQRLKSTIGWRDSGNGSDVFGFRALPAGYFNGAASGLGGDFGYWLSTAENNASKSWSRFLSKGNLSAGRYNYGKSDGLSARCLEDKVDLDTSFGVPWNPAIAFDTLKDDRDGISYRTVKIGTQWWMAENLNYKRPGPDSGLSFSSATEDPRKSGRLYSWSSLMDLPISCDLVSCSSQVQAKHRGICPAGWHVPSDEDWNALGTSTGGDSTVGLRLKAIGDWTDSGNGTDTYGFRALAGGFGTLSGDILNVGFNGYWWSATPIDGTTTRSRYLAFDGMDLYRHSHEKTYRFSARCVRD